MLKLLDWRLLNQLTNKQVYIKQEWLTIDWQKQQRMHFSPSPLPLSPQWAFQSLSWVFLSACSVLKKHQKKLFRQKSGANLHPCRYFIWEPGKRDGEKVNITHRIAIKSVVVLKPFLLIPPLWRRRKKEIELYLEVIFFVSSQRFLQILPLLSQFF